MEESNAEATPTPLINHAAKFGGILAACSIVLVILIYIVDLSLLATFKFLFLAIVLGLGIVIWGGIDYRKELGGFMPYGKALVYSFAVLAISGVISTLFNLVLYNFVDPDLPQKMVDAISTNTEEMMRNFGAPQDRIDETLDQMKIDLPKQFSNVGLLLGFAKQTIWWAVISLITGLFIRKNQPVEL